MQADDGLDILVQDADEDGLQLIDLIMMMRWKGRIME